MEQKVELEPEALAVKTEKPTTCGGRAFDELNIVMSLYSGTIVTSQN
jgi:hypothetical protein